MMSKNISVRNASEHNLKNVSVDVPPGKLVVVVGKSGSGKSSFVYDVLFRASQGKSVNAKVSNLPKTTVISQQVVADKQLSLGQTNKRRLVDALAQMKKGELLIVDEPCAGMAKDDRDDTVSILKDSVKKGISVLVVEHSKDVIASADYVIEFGPESGVKGGEVVFEGPIAKYKSAKTPTSEYVFSKKAEIIGYARNPNKSAELAKNREVTVTGITANHLNNFSFTFPLGSIVCVCGKMGTGKSTLLSVVYGALYKGKDAWKVRHGFKTVIGKGNVRRSYFVDQTNLSPISTSTPATYLGIWDVVRDAFACLPESKKLKLGKSHFSFNKKVSAVTERKLRTIRYNNKSVYDVLDMTIDQAVKLFADLPSVVRKLGFLREVGLGYLILGQKSNTLSGGEAQRVRLAKILSKKLGDRCVYIMDVPSRGLHLSDLPILMRVFQKIVDKNNTVLIAENREEIIANCDRVLELK